MHRHNRLTLLWVLIVLLISAVVSVQADVLTFDQAQQDGVQQNPSAITFTLKLADGKTQFHIGERIRLALSFTASRPEVYQLETNFSERGDLATTEDFHSDPAATDPLANDPHYSDVNTYSGPGRRYVSLGVTPQTVTVDLNEWLAFDKPGHYRVYADTQRVIPKETADTGSRKSLPITSSVVEFDILPYDDAWAAARLHMPVTPVDPKDYPDDYQAAFEETARRSMERRLRYLRTTEAAKELIRHLESIPNNTYTSQERDCELGLIESPQRPFVIAEMQRELAAPDAAINKMFLSILVTLQYDEARSLRKKQTAEQFRNVTYSALTAGVMKKQGFARAESLLTLLDDNFDAPSSIGLSPIQIDEVVAQRKFWVAQLITVFTDLPTTDQELALHESRWPMIRSTQMLPVLRRILQNTTPLLQNQNYEAFQVYNLAAQRLYELSPAEGRRFILKRIASLRPLIDEKVLYGLPDKRLPQLDNTLAKNLEHGGSCGLVARYATPAILPRVKKVFGDGAGHWACAPQADILGYFLRTDPAFGISQFSKALSSRNVTGCYHPLFTDVGQWGMGPALERIAVEHLSDPDDEVAANAAEALGRYGSPAAEAPLWKRLQAWHDQWQGKAPGTAYLQTHLAATLAHALATAPAWRADAAALARLQQLCLTRDVRWNANVDRIQNSSPGKVSVFAHTVQPDNSLDPDEWQVDQYTLGSVEALEQKLRQYPRGTVFGWEVPSYTDSPRTRRVFQNLQAFLQKNGMRLVPSTARTDLGFITFYDLP